MLDNKKRDRERVKQLIYKGINGKKPAVADFYVLFKRGYRASFKFF